MFLLSLGVKFGIQKRFERNDKSQVQCRVERAASEQDCKLICLILCAGPESGGVCENCKCCEKFEKKANLLMGLEVSLQLCRFAVFTVLQFLDMMVSRPGLQLLTSWIQCKLEKQYLLKQITLPWESNPRPSPIRGVLVTVLVSVGLKRKAPHSVVKRRFVMRVGAARHFCSQ